MNEIEELQREIKALKEDMEIIKELLRQNHFRFRDELSF